MSDFSGLAIAGRVATPNDPDWDQARMAWNLAADQRPSRRRLRRERRRHRRGGALRRRERTAGFRPVDRPWRRRARLARGRDPDQDRADARDRDRRRCADGASRGRGALGRAGRSRPGSTVSARCRARLPTSASPASTSAAASAGSAASTGSPATGCGRSSSSPPTARRCIGRRRQRARPLLGAARRWRRLRDRRPPCTSTWSRSTMPTPARSSRRPRSAPRPSASTATGRPGSARTSPRSSAS